MNKLFIIQLVASFFVGGILISLISFIAEKVNARTAGIVLAIPSTAAVGFFFLGWTLSPEKAASVVPSGLIPLGLCMLFAAIYAYTAVASSKFLKKKISQIIFSFLISISVWLLCAIPIAFLQLSSLIIGSVGYFVLIIIAHFLLNRKNYSKAISPIYTPWQKIGRAAFAGSIITLAVFLGKILSPFFGGVFAMFPAAFSSSFVVFHWYYDPEKIFPIIQKVAIGSLSTFMYAITVMLAFPKFGFILGTLIAYIVSFITLVLIIKIQDVVKIWV